jgi:hypothetical protein
MLNVFLAFVFGAAVMDFMWAYKMGMPQAMWQRWKSRLIRK